MEILLPENETMTIDPVPRRLRIVCRSGEIWLTQSNDARDFLLRPGQAFTTAGKGRIVLWALAPAQVTVEAGLAEPALVWQPRLRRV